MKDTKVFVDLDDEITFVSDKVLKAPTNRVILVVPEKSSVIASLVGLKMLRRIFDKNNKDVVLVTTDEIGKRVALNAGFVSAQRIGDVNDDLWRESISLKKRFAEASKLSNKIAFSEDIYAVVDNKTETDSNPNEEINTNNSSNDAIVSDSNAHKAEPVKRISFQSDEVDNEPTKEEIGKDQKIEDNIDGLSKKVSLDGFDLLVGGDVASSDNIGNNNEFKSNRYSENKGWDYAKQDSSNSKFAGNKESSSPPPHPNGASFVNSILGRMPKMKNAKTNRIFIILGIFILLCLFIIYYLFLTTADVSIQVKGEPLSSTATILINPNISSINASKLEIPAKVFVVSESGSDSAPTTGSKTVTTGNFASGSITLTNSTSNSITLPSGTVFTGSSNYTCTNSSPVTVPAATENKSGGVVTGVTYGTVSFTCTASVNTADVAGDTFSVQGYSSSELTGTNPNAFTAGNESSQTEQVVSASDQQNLEQSLSSQLYQRGQTDLQAKVGNYSLISQSIQNIVVNATFDNQVGTQAQVLNLSEQTKTEGEAYNPNDFMSVLKANLEGNSNLVRNMAVSVKKIDVVSGQVEAVVSYQAILYKNTNKTNIANAIKGKSFSTAKKYIYGIKNVKSVTITDHPRIFSLIGYLPSNLAKIHVSISD